MVLSHTFYNATKTGFTRQHQDDIRSNCPLDRHQWRQITGQCTSTLDNCTESMASTDRSMHGLMISTKTRLLIHGNDLHINQQINTGHQRINTGHQPRDRCRAFHKTRLLTSRVRRPPVNEASKLAALVHGSLNELHESACVLVRFDRRYFRTRSVLHGLCCLCRALLHAVVREDVNETEEVDLLLLTV